MTITGQALGLAAYETEARDARGRFFHGTTDKYRPGDVIDPSRPHRANFDPEHSEPKSVYFAGKVKQALHYAERDKGGLGEPHVYEVEPTGEHWPIAPGVTQYQTKSPLRVVREVNLATEMTGEAGSITAQALDLAAGGTITTQLANRGYELSPRSGMISLDLPPGMITPVPGDVSDHHVTVVYLGKDVDDEAFAVACERAQAAAASVPGPLNGMVGGIGTFPPSGGSDGKVPVWAGVVLPGAELLRSALEDLSASEHKHWAPHVTLAYADPGDPLPPPVPSMQVSFSHLSVHRGDDEVIRYPIGGGPGAELAVPKGSARPSRAGGTITGQMDLGWDGWRAESRDSHGRWSRSEATAVAGGAAGRVEHDRSLVSDARTASPEEFSRAFEGAFAGSPFRAFVNHYTPQQMRDEHMTPVLAAGGKAGVLVHPHGDGRIEPTALFNTSGRKGMGLALLRMAIEKHGANYVECFGPALNKMYGTLGFKDGDVYPFDPGEAPADWDRAKFDSPDYHTMNLAAQRQKVIAAASEDEGLDLGEVRRQANCTEDEWEAALAVFGIASPSAGSSKTAGHPGA